MLKLRPLVLLALAGAGTLLCTGARATSTTLTFEQRVAAQRAIERVYWNHRIWPAENRGNKPPLEKALPDQVLRAKVTRYLKLSNALESIWRRPVTSAQLQAELNRMVSGTRSPQVLQELFAALGNDPYLIAETLARQTLVERAARSAYAGDTLQHASVRAKAEAAGHGLEKGSGALRGISVDYVEVEWAQKAASDSTRDELEVTLNEAEWEAATARFGSPLRVGARSTLEEESDRFQVMEVLERSPDTLKVGVASWPKMDFDAWLSERGPSLPEGIEDGGPRDFFVLPGVLPTQACVLDTWQPTSTDVPDARTGHSAVWTGTEMIVWGGLSSMSSVSFNTGARYDPATDTWKPTSTGAFAPSARFLHTAVWTGTEMIVWGGGPSSSVSLNTGGRYDPVGDTWKPTSITQGTPAGRLLHTAVWTGKRMIVWGGAPIVTLPGQGPVLDTGGRYDPDMDRWEPTSLGPNLPSGRVSHTAVWTGHQMIVWGGFADTYLNTGARYSPVTDSWSPMSTGTGVPTPRRWHTAVWTGSLMIVYGGSGTGSTLDTGGRYHPLTDSWTPMQTSSRRTRHSAIWAGTEMIVWGGVQSPSPRGVGGRYDPTTDGWTATSTNQEAESVDHAAVWTGSEMIVWGINSALGPYSNRGARYSPQTDTWMPTSTKGTTPSARQGHAAVWTGAEMIVWGGFQERFENTGGRYDPALDTWTPVSSATAPIEVRGDHSAVWTGTEMIIWGGRREFNGKLSSGARFNPTTGNWRVTSVAGSPTARFRHSAVWTGKEMIVWGGEGTAPLNTGGRYDPASDTWRPTSLGVNVPNAGEHRAVWTGKRMLVWGQWEPFPNVPQVTGGSYDPGTDSWAPIATDASSPSPRRAFTAVWTGTEMIVWGGNSQVVQLQSGGHYDPLTDAWTPTSITSDTLSARGSHTALWTGREMIVWGGGFQNAAGARYDPVVRRWSPMSSGDNAPLTRLAHTVVWTGTEMIVWGGGFGSWYSATGGRYCPAESTSGATPSTEIVGQGGNGDFTRKLDSLSR